MFGHLFKLKIEANWIQGSRDPGIRGSKSKRHSFVSKPLRFTNLALLDPGIQGKKIVIHLKTFKFANLAMWDPVIQGSKQKDSYLFENL